MRRVCIGLLVAALLGLSACSSSDLSLPTPGPRTTNVDVDTPELRQAKADLGVADCTPGTGTAVDDGLPDVTLPCFGGGPDVDLSALKGPMVVNLWASWCGPCRQEMPVLQAFHEQYGDQVTVLGVDYQDPQTGGAMKLVEKSGVTYPLLADPAGLLQRAAPFVVRGLPMVALVDADGTVTHIEAVELKDVQQLVDLVDDHLGLDL